MSGEKVRSHPMRDVTVVDLSQIYNGPYATFLMAMAGAAVIKVEPPGGESLRRRAAVGGAALAYAMLNGCKQSIVLDLKAEAGKAALKRLVADADVLVENFSPGVMERLGLGWETLSAVNPRLIYASSSGYGRDGPYRDYPAMDLTMQAMGGVLHSTGFPDQPPVKAGPAIADFAAGTHLFGAIATALYARERTGEGQCVEVAMQDALYPTLSSSLGMVWGAAEGEPVPARTGNRHGGLAECPYNVFPTSDGQIAILCVGENQWCALAATMGRPELAGDARFTTLEARVSRMDEVDALVSEWTIAQPTSVLFARLMSARIPCAPVRTLEEVMHDPNMHARGALQHVEHPQFGPMILQQTPLRFAGVPLLPLEPSRPLGADTAGILSARYGFTDEEIAAAGGKPRLRA
jgi:CoA:oxalate CoA-transferase